MSYISYFDLLGTRGFCENSQLYFQNITTFHEVLSQLSPLLRKGNVGLFSDCAYAQSSNLIELITFLVQVRDRLMSCGLYFNAVVKEGDLGISNVKGTEARHTLGVVFTNSSIADLYITQSKFKGIGISVDEKIIEDIMLDGRIKINRCIFLDKVSDSNNMIVKPLMYYDVAFNFEHHLKEIEYFLKIFYRDFYSAYVKSPRFGKYYVSAICNLLRSCNCNFEWDYTKKQFVKQPIIFKTVEKILESDELSDFDGREYLALVMLDVVYCSFSEEEALKAYTKKIAGITCVKKKFLHSLTDIPKELFSENSKLGINNRELFIQYCQDDLSGEFVDALLGTIE